MERSPYGPHQWRHLIPNIDSLIEQMERVPILSLGITPYTRMIPGFFLKNYSIYVPQRSSDVDVMERYVRMHVLEDRDPKLAAKVHSTGYLLNSYAFKNFLASRRGPVILMLNSVNEKSIESAAALGCRLIGNPASTIERVTLKGDFRALVRERGLPSLPSATYERDAFLTMSFQKLWDANDGAFVLQRADKEVGGNEGTFYIHTEEDFIRAMEAFAKDDTFAQMLVTPFIEGYSASMLGCVLPEGILSGPLQLQLIDVPESLHGVEGNGMFFGNDLGVSPWGTNSEKTAQEVVESLGEFLRGQGYKGVFGIDFLYDKNRDALYPNECNPRFTGSLALYSLMLLDENVPPLEFFHLLAHLDVELPRRGRQQ